MTCPIELGGHQVGISCHEELERCPSGARSKLAPTSGAQIPLQPISDFSRRNCEPNVVFWVWGWRTGPLSCATLPRSIRPKSTKSSDLSGASRTMLPFGCNVRRTMHGPHTHWRHTRTDIYIDAMAVKFETSEEATIKQSITERKNNETTYDIKHQN